MISSSLSPLSLPSLLLPLSLSLSPSLSPSVSLNMVLARHAMYRYIISRPKTLEDSPPPTRRSDGSCVMPSIMSSDHAQESALLGIDADNNYDPGTSMQVVKYLQYPGTIRDCTFCNAAIQYSCMEKACIKTSIGGQKNWI